MVLTPLRESHSARGNPRIYAPKGPPEAISPGGPLQAHWWLDRLPCVPINDDRGHRGVLGAASLGTVVGVRCAVGVQGSPTGRGAGSLCHAALSRRASIEIPKRSVFRDLKELL